MSKNPRITIIERIPKFSPLPVYKVKKESEKEDNFYACKILDLDEFRVINELNALVTLQHPNILKITDFWIEGGDDKDEKSLFLLFPLADCNLDEYLISKNLSDLDKIILIIKIIKAIGYIHSQGLYHGDIKGANIVMIEDEPFIIDFGLSGIIGNLSSKYCISTPYACSPQCLEFKPMVTLKTLGRESTFEERFFGNKKQFPIFYEEVNPVQNDIFSLGNLIFYILCNGKNSLITVKVKNFSMEDTWEAYLYFIDNYASILKITCGNEELSNFLMRMVAPSQKDRYSNLKEILKFFKCDEDLREDSKIWVKEDVINNLKRRCEDLDVKSKIKNVEVIDKNLEFLTLQLFEAGEDYSYFEGEDEEIEEQIEDQIENDLMQILYIIKGKILQ